MKRILCILSLIFLLALSAAIAEEEGGYVLAADNGQLQLYINPDDLSMRVTDISSGQSWETNVMNGKNGNKTTKNNQKSDLRVYYIVNEDVGTTNSMDSYSMSVAYSNYTLEYIENGVEIRYTIGDKTISVDDLPKMVPLDKYYEKLLPYWLEKDDKAFREFYRVYKNSMWVRTDDGNIGKVKLNNLYSLFYDKSTYTKEDLAEDNAAYGYEIEKINPSITLTLRVTLDGSELLASVPCSSIEYTKGNPVTRIDVLPYFLSADTEHSGYIFVPDGSGSLIYLNNGKTMALSYADRVYGSDALMNVDTYSAPSDPIRLPVYGIKTENSAILAIIENGAELASITADISGRSDEFNRVYSYFTLRDIELVSVIGTASGRSPRYPDDIFTDDIVIRYKFLTCEEATYTSMAHAYREYLINAGRLREREMPEDAPLFADIIGAVRQTKFFAGIPYESTAVATTLDQAKEILSALRNTGVKNPRLLLKGYWEGGIKHEELTDLSLESSAGSKKSLAALTQAAVEAGGGTYMVTNLEKVYSTSGFSKNSDAARRQDNFTANVQRYAEPILSREREYVDSFYISPAYVQEYSSEIAKRLDKAKLGISGLALDDIGCVLIGDYRNKANINRHNAQPSVVSAINTISEGRDVYMNAPSDYALLNAEAVYGLPDSDNGFKVEDESIPFIQLVLEGSCVCSAGAWNESAYTGVWREMNYAIESKSAPRFALTYADETVFMHTEDMETQNYFMTQYKQWLDEIEYAYAEYNAFWRTVSHSIPAKGLRRVEYDNGVTVYVNYLASDTAADGYTVPARGYLIVEAD